MTGLSFVFTAVGLLLTILGSYFGASAYFVTKLSEIRLQSFIHIGCNLSLAKSIVIQRNKIIIGFILILIGTIFQVVPIFIENEIYLTIKKTSCMIFFIICFIILLVLIEFLVKKRSEKHILMIDIYDNLLSYNSCTEKIDKSNTEELRQQGIKIRNQYRDRIGALMKIDITSVDFDEEDLYKKALKKCAFNRLNKV
jgi:hypothetical protein